MDLRLLRYLVTAVEEGNLGRAAERLHMTQPPLSRAIHQLEVEFGVPLLLRTRAGVEPTESGQLLYDEARPLLAHADSLVERVTRGRRAAVLAVGVLVDTSDETFAIDLVDAFRRHHPGVLVRIVELDLGAPTAGLLTAEIDVAVTRGPISPDGITARVARTDRVGVVLPASDPVASSRSLTTTDLADRRWVRLPDEVDPVFRGFWTGGTDPAAGPVVRTVQECLHEALWNGALVIAPEGQSLPDGLALVPLADRGPSEVIVAWRTADRDPLVGDFVTVVEERIRA